MGDSGLTCSWSLCDSVAHLSMRLQSVMLEKHLKGFQNERFFCHNIMNGVDYPFKLLEGIKYQDET